MKKAKKFANRYPWKDWFATGKFTLKQGVDFQVLPHGMAGMIRNAARSKLHGLRVSVFVRINGNIDVVVLGKRKRVKKII